MAGSPEEHHERHEPRGVVAISRHYLRDLVYGANDGVITTFAVVAGVAGGALPPVAVLIVGVANLAADGLSMGVGNFLSIRAYQSARLADGLSSDEPYPARHGVATFAAFAVAGAIPLAPYLFPLESSARIASSVILTLMALFAIGAARALVTADRWWKAGLEALSLGVLVAVAAYLAGWIAASLVGTQ